MVTSSEEETMECVITPIEQRREKPLERTPKEPMVPQNAGKKQQQRDTRQSSSGKGKDGKTVGEERKTGQDRIEEPRNALDEEIRQEMNRVVESINSLERQKARLDDLIKESKRIPVRLSGDILPLSASRHQVDPGDGGRGRKKKKKKVKKSIGGEKGDVKGITTSPKVSPNLADAPKVRAVERERERESRGEQKAIETWVTVVKRRNKNPPAPSARKNTAPLLPQPSKKRGKDYPNRRELRRSS